MSQGHKISIIINEKKLDGYNVGFSLYAVNTIGE